MMLVKITVEHKMKSYVPPRRKLRFMSMEHGLTKASANEQFNRTAISLATNNYAIPLIGFSWDSNTPFNEDGWKTAKTIAEKNGLKLARFIIDFKNECQDTDIRLIAHSLGER